ncbi:MAG: hypothetical protein CMJ49_05830 [Planctomycetaceae bacterium]|nr:hypothetical protein [Planctomycetaceae bacterium]
MPLYDRPLGSATDATDDGRPVITITDFSACTPAQHIGGVGPGFWDLIDYETDAFGGRLLHADRAAGAADVVLPLNVNGWYAVYVWQMGGDADLEKQFPFDLDSVYSQSAGPALKLSRDAHFSGHLRTLSHDYMMWRGIEAGFWRYDDLTDQSITIRHQGGTVYLAAIQLIPLSPGEVEAVERDRADPARRRLIVKGDDFDPNHGELWAQRLRDSDVCAWIAGCEDTEKLMSPNGAQNITSFCRAMRDIGIEAYIGERPSLWSLYVHWGDQRAVDYDRHPEWHCRDRDGTHTHTCSYAVPEVVDYMLARARAVAEAGPDGFGYFFNRGEGMVLFEPAAMAGFEQQHGVDPLTLSDRDDRLLAWRADIVTDFLRKVRQLLDDVAAEKGYPRIKMVHVVLGCEAANRFHAFDVPTWVNEGLVDVLCPYPWADYPDRWLCEGFVDVDVKYYAQLVSGTDVKLYPMWLAGIWRSHWTPEHVQMKDYFTQAMSDYADGADGISAWDFVGLDTAFRADRWLRLGHKDNLADWATDDFPLPPKLRFTRYAGRTPDRYPVGTGG